MYEKIFKRLFDIFFSFFFLAILSPLFAVISVLILCFDDKKIIFSQTRVGKGTNNFTFYKFRTLPIDTSNIPSADISLSKITWIGKFLRRTNLDELPQLFNILKGDMSVVGPRPSLPSQKDLIDLRASGNVFNCRPGLTGLAQIKSYDGMSNQSKADYDLKYSSNISFINDIKIILLTFAYLLKPPPKY